MRRLSMSVLFALLATLTVIDVRADTIEEMPGATAKEREIRWIWKYLGEFVRDCDRIGTACQDAALKPIVSKLAGALPATASSSQLVFVSEKAQPEIFQSEHGETHRIATTQRTATSVIYINTDRMDLKSLEWVGLLAHEAVHHLGYDDDAQRWPDRVGAAVAAYVGTNWQESSLAEYGQPLMKLMSYSKSDMSAPARIAIGNAVNLLDQSATPNPRVPICEAGETFAGQSVGAAIWRVVLVRGDQKLARMRVSARVSSRCVSAAGAARAVWTNFTIMIDLNFSRIFDPQEDWWTLPSTIDLTSLAGGNDDSQSEAIDIYRTFEILSVKNESPVIQAGQTWKVAVEVQGTDDFQPAGCSGMYSGSKWFFHRLTSTMMFDTFATCQITAIGPKKWLVSMTKQIPAEARPDLFSISFIYFSDASGSARFAVPARPKYIDVRNAQARPAARIVATRILGLQPRARVGGTAAADLYSVQPGQKFAIEIDLLGTQQPKRQFIDLDQWVQYNGNFVTLANSSDVTKSKEIVTNITTTPISGGTRIHYDVVFPRTASGLVVGALKLRGFNIETDDYAWSEIAYPGPVQNLIFTDLVEK